MELPGLLFIIVGVVIGVVSYFSELYPFIAVAVGFIIWGIIKIIRKRISNNIPNPKKEHKDKAEHHKPAHHIHYTKSSKTIACKKCGLKHYNHANYCQHCGAKLK